VAAVPADGVILSNWPLSIVNFPLFLPPDVATIRRHFEMRIPSDKLDDFMIGVEPKQPPPPPDWVVLGSSGDFETLKPLAYWEDYVKQASGSSAKKPARRRLSWFHRSLAMSGAVAVIGLMVGTGAFLKMYGPPSAPTDNLNSSVVSPTETAAEPQTNYIAETSGDQDDSGSLIDENSPSSFMPPDTVPTMSKHRTYRPRVNRSAARPRVLFAANRVRHHFLPRPQFIVSDFVPTTLVIYVDKGQIKTRIEPHLNATYKRTPASSQQ
jgi:hypothetical protein